MVKKAVAEKPEPPKPKRGQYKKKECPYCHKHLGNLENHIRLKHPAEAKKDGRATEPPPASKEQLLGIAPANPPADLPEKITYFCQGTFEGSKCKAELRKGENPCWQCGEYLNWEGIE